MSDVIVIGSLNLDLVVAVERLPQPGETVAGPSAERAPGGWPEFAADPGFRRRFEKAVAIAARVHGPYTAPVIDCDAHAPP